MRDSRARRFGTIGVAALGLVAAACSSMAADRAAAESSTTVSPATVAPTTISPTTVSPTTAADAQPDDLDGPVDAVLTNLGDARIAAFGGVACAEEVVMLLVAIDRFRQDTGRVATDFSDLEAAVGGPLDLWTWPGGDADPTPRAGSGCSSAGFDAIDQDATSICSIERRTIETAVETFRALHPTADAPNEDDLVGDFLQEPSDRWDLDGWAVVPAPDSICEPS